MTTVYNKITISVTVNAPVDKVWEYFTTPVHITKWNHASNDWHSPRASNDLRVGGKFNYRMESKDGKMGFDFEGTFQEIKPGERLAYTIADGRNVVVEFRKSGGITEVSTIFEAENINSEELQRAGWQAILDNFKKVVEKEK